MTKKNRPVAVGVPEKRPDDDNETPGGSVSGQGAAWAGSDAIQKQFRSEARAWLEKAVQLNEQQTQHVLVRADYLLASLDADAAMLLAALVPLFLTAWKLIDINRESLEAASRDAPQDDDPTNPVSEVVADENALAPDEHLNRDDTARFIQELLGKLPELHVTLKVVYGDPERKSFVITITDDDTLLYETADCAGNSESGGGVWLKAWSRTPRT